MCLWFIPPLIAHRGNAFRIKTFSGQREMISGTILMQYSVCKCKCSRHMGVLKHCAHIIQVISGMTDGNSTWSSLTHTYIMTLIMENKMSSTRWMWMNDQTYEKSSYCLHFTIKRWSVLGPLIGMLKFSHQNVIILIYRTGWIKKLCHCVLKNDWTSNSYLFHRRCLTATTIPKLTNV